MSGCCGFAAICSPTIFCALVQQPSFPDFGFAPMGLPVRQQEIDKASTIKTRASTKNTPYPNTKM